MLSVDAYRFFFKLAKGVYIENVSIIDTGSPVKENLVVT